jgi:hypothetical protein
MKLLNDSDSLMNYISVDVSPIKAVNTAVLHCACSMHYAVSTNETPVDTIALLTVFQYNSFHRLKSESH